jgi:signal peptidase II
MRVLWISAVVVFIDQATKAAVLHFMTRYESIPVLGDWLKLTFTENPGMAFGIQFGPEGFVTILSIIATVLVVYYLVQVRDQYLPYRASLAAILGGALGNIIDRVFYGVLLGYDGFFTGHVVDFIHVSMWEGFLPPSVPFIGGAYLELFPIWNVADMAIVGGVIGMLFFQNTFHERLHEAELAEADAASDAPGDPAAAAEPSASEDAPSSYRSPADSEYLSEKPSQAS